MSKKQQQVRKQVREHKDPVKFPVIEKYEKEFKNNFSYISKSIVQDIKKKLTKGK